MSTQSLLHTQQSGNKFAYIIGAVAVVALTSGVTVGALSQPSSTELYAPAATTVRSGVQAAAPITRMGSARQASAAFGAAAAPAAGFAAPVAGAQIAYAPSTFATSSIAAFIGMMIGAGAMVLAKMGGQKQAPMVEVAMAGAAPIAMAATSGTKADEGTKAFAKLPASVKPGVVTGKALNDLLEHAKQAGFAIPGVNIVGSNSINSCMEAAAKYGGPIMVTFSKGGGQFIAGKAADNTDDAASIAGCIAGAKHVREVAKLYGVPVVLHTDHCQKAWLPWFDGLLEANEEYYAQHGEPLFSSHMLDLSEEPLEENIAICKKYMERMAKVELLLEFELGITGGEEDGVDNTDVDSSRLYTQPEEVYYSYQQLSEIPNAMFTCAASFGNVHGVYAPGNVDLQPVILHNSQKYIQEKLGCEDTKPMKFVFHGGSGSSTEDIQYAIEAGVIKMNIDTDTQWGFWDGVRAYEAENHDYLQGQIGNPDGADKPNKKYYDPRMMLRAGEESMAARLVKAAQDLKCVNVLN